MSHIPYLSLAALAALSVAAPADARIALNGTAMPAICTSGTAVNEVAAQRISATGTATAGTAAKPARRLAVTVPGPAR